MSASPFPFDGVLFGAAYYPEYHLRDRTDVDLDLMMQAGFSVIRVGESVWSTWEPRDGEFELDWLQPALDGAHARGISVIIGTPTYAIPPWMQQAHPELAAERRTGERIPFGARQEVDYTHPTFRRFAERVIRQIMERYADHPAVIGFQVDNEPGLELFHNDHVFVGFREWLARRYGDVAVLNREWGLTYWSHRINDWSELWRPDGNSLPQYDLAWRRYQAELTTEFIGWQYDIVREYASNEQFVMTCINYPRNGHDDRALAERLDVTAGNPYYSMQDHLDATKDLVAQTHWTTSGVAAFFRQADRLFSSRQSRFLVTETNAQSIDGSSNNMPPWPGQLRMAALSMVSRGAAMIEYWHWHSLPYGTETYWGGILPHSLRPGRIYGEISEIGHALRELNPVLNGMQPDADVAILWSNPTRWAMQFAPPLSENDQPLSDSFERIFDAFHSGIVGAGGQARILHLEQAAELGGEALANRFPVLVAAGLLVASDAELDLLRDYAAAGGHLVLGPRTGYGDDEVRARVAVAPDRLAEASGIHYEEFSNIATAIPITTNGSHAGVATFWIDGLIADNAQTIAHYEHPRFGRFPAIASHSIGNGRVTTVGTLPSPELAATVMRMAAGAFIGDSLAPDRDLTVTLTSGVNAAGARVWFASNWSGTDTEITVARSVADPESGISYPPGTTVPTPAWSTTLLVDDHPERSGSTA